MPVVLWENPLHEVCRNFVKKIPMGCVRVPSAEKNYPPINLALQFVKAVWSFIQPSKKILFRTLNTIQLIPQQWDDLLTWNGLRSLHTSWHQGMSLLNSPSSAQCQYSQQSVGKWPRPQKSELSSMTRHSRQSPERGIQPSDKGDARAHREKVTDWIRLMCELWLNIEHYNYFAAILHIWISQGSSGLTVGVRRIYRILNPFESKADWDNLLGLEFAYSNPM